MGGIKSSTPSSLTVSRIRGSRGRRLVSCRWHVHRNFPGGEACKQVSFLFTKAPFGQMLIPSLLPPSLQRSSKLPWRDIANTTHRGASFGVCSQNWLWNRRGVKIAQRANRCRLFSQERHLDIGSPRQNCPLRCNDLRSYHGGT